LEIVHILLVKATNKGQARFDFIGEKQLGQKEQALL
jgi:hypothetical protein